MVCSYVGCVCVCVCVFVCHRKRKRGREGGREGGRERERARARERERERCLKRKVSHRPKARRPDKIENMKYCRRQSNIFLIRDGDERIGIWPGDDICDGVPRYRIGNAFYNRVTYSVCRGGDVGNGVRRRYSLARQNKRADRRAGRASQAQAACLQSHAPAVPAG